MMRKQFQGNIEGKGNLVVRSDSYSVSYCLKVYRRIVEHSDGEISEGLWDIKGSLTVLDDELPDLFDCNEAHLTCADDKVISITPEPQLDPNKDVTFSLRSSLDSSWIESQLE